MMNRREALSVGLLGVTGLTKTPAPVVRDVGIVRADVWETVGVQKIALLNTSPVLLEALNKGRLKPCPICPHFGRDYERPKETVGSVLSFSFDGRWLRATVELNRDVADRHDRGEIKLRPQCLTHYEGSPIRVAHLNEINYLAVVPKAEALWGNEAD